MLSKAVFEAYEAGFVSAIEEVHEKLLEMQRDDCGRVLMVDVLDIVDSYIKKEWLQ